MEENTGLKLSFTLLSIFFTRYHVVRNGRSHFIKA